MSEKLVAANRRAGHDYHILEKYEAGIELQGTEVKSLRAGRLDLRDSYAEVIEGQIYLQGAHISPYEHGNIYNHDPDRRRRLLMHRREIHRIGAKVAEKGYTLIPLRVYFSQGLAKVEVGLCRGKRLVDKRETLREREALREMQRAVKARRSKHPLQG
jgi:SsrA-binding protein